LQIARQIGGPDIEGNALWNMAHLLFHEMGDYERAVTCAEAALQIYERIESPYADMVRKSLAHWREHPEHAGRSADA
jgi:hypothetical protein